MGFNFIAWLKGRPKRWAHLDDVPLTQLSTYMFAVFCLSSVVGFYGDLISGGRQPYPVVMAEAAFSGFNAALWILVLARLPVIWIFALFVGQFFSFMINIQIARWVPKIVPSPAVDPADGVRFASTAILFAVIASYVLFVAYIRNTGKESFRLKAELAIAHSIQKTLVPMIDQRVSSFDIFGVSEPSEKVGGDLVDLVEMRGGDIVVYIADIAGHGLKAGILMGMLKTAARTVLLKQGGDTGGTPLSQLMDQLNEVLPQVKEASMYATFTGLRLNLDGRAFYGMAASPPLLHWRARTKQITRIQEEQFPLGLLQISEFSSSELVMEVDDVLMIATDGIYEVSSKGDDFGFGALEKLLRENASVPLSDIASIILKSVRGYGKQVDDQTL